MTCTHDFHWYMAPADESGWKCVNCGDKPGEPPGYSPDLDASHTYIKVFAVLHDLHDAGIIYVSNGSGGDGICESVAAECRADRAYDQVSIASRIMAFDEDHAKFWRDRGDAIRAGKDMRHRCHCGKLATTASSRAGSTEWVHTCSAHSRLFND